MKRVAILMLVIGLSATNAISQGLSEEGAKKEMTTEQRADKRTEMMVDKLDLTTEQTEEIREINRAHAMKMEKIHEEMKALHKKAKDEKQQAKKKIDAVLDDDQKSVFEEEIQKHKEERKKKRKEKCCHENE